MNCVLCLCMICCELSVSVSVQHGRVAYAFLAVSVVSMSYGSLLLPGAFFCSVMGTCVTGGCEKHFLHGLGRFGWGVGQVYIASYAIIVAGSCRA